MSPFCNIGTVGYFSCGKSTLLAQLLINTGCITNSDINKARNNAIEDKLKYNNKSYSCVDTPGIKRLFKTTIKSLAQVEVVLFVVECFSQSFKKSNNPILEYIKNSIILFKALGIQNIIVCINKMDIVNYSQDLFNKTCSILDKLFKNRGITSSHIQYIPISAYNGDNLIEYSQNMLWWKEKTLIDIIDSIPPFIRDINGPLYIPIINKYRIGGVGIVACGRIISGTIEKNNTITLKQRSLDTQSLQYFETPCNKAIAGEYIGVNLVNILYSNISRGDVITNISGKTEISSFIVKVLIVNKLGKLKEGYSPYLFCHAAKVPCKWIKFLDITKHKSSLKDNNYLEIGDTVSIQIKILKPIFVELYELCPQLGRIIMLDGNEIIAFGIISQILQQGRSIKSVH